MQRSFGYRCIVSKLNAVAQENFTINVIFADTQEKMMIHFNNGALLQYYNMSSETADLTITSPKNALALIIQGNMDVIGAVMKLEGDTSKLRLIIDHLNQFDTSGKADFNIVEP